MYVKRKNSKEKKWQKNIEKSQEKSFCFYQLFVPQLKSFS